MSLRTILRRMIPFLIKPKRPDGVFVGRATTQDSVRIMAQVWELQLSESHKLVLLAFGDHANDEGICFPSIARVAWKCGLSERQVQRIVAALRKIGLLSAVNGMSGGRKRTTLYRVSPEKGDKLSPFVPGKGDVPGPKTTTSATGKDDMDVTRIISNHQKEPVAARVLGAKHIEGPEKAVQPFLLTELTAKKEKHRPLWVRGELAEDLYRGIHDRKIGNAFFDARTLNPRDRIAACVNVAVTSLVTARVATLKVLSANEIEKQAVEELLRGLATLELVRDFEARRRQTVQAVTRVVIGVCVRMLGA